MMAQSPQTGGCVFRCSTCSCGFINFSISCSSCSYLLFSHVCFCSQCSSFSPRRPSACGFLCHLRRPLKPWPWNAVTLVTASGSSSFCHLFCATELLLWPCPRTWSAPAVGLSGDLVVTARASFTITLWLASCH